MVYTIRPKDYYYNNSKFIMQYWYWTKKEAIQLYLAKFSQFKRNELIIE